jgi:5-methyltetrahydropteroyltriglutamate--homocysteine methyltransferase
METYDVGSMPFEGDYEKFLKGAYNFISNHHDDSTVYFERKVVESFVDKLAVGFDIPNYPQFRDMNTMFFDMMDGLERLKDGYIERELISIKNGRKVIPEVLAIERNSGEIYERIGEPFKVKICVTGPYTLSSFFVYRDPDIFRRLGEVISTIVEESIFKNKYATVRIVAIDEPIFGLIDDPQIDIGSLGRTSLLNAWEKICLTAAQKGAETCMHLHNTANELFWQVNSLKIVESHVGDYLYISERTKKLLEKKDKRLKASVCITIFDKLIENSLLSKTTKTKNAEVTDRISEVWTEIRQGRIDPKVFIEKTEIMKKRLRKIVQKFGQDRVIYSGPECGLRSFPTYDSGIECLRRVSEASKI